MPSRSGSCLNRGPSRKTRMARSGQTAAAFRTAGRIAATERHDGTSDGTRGTGGDESRGAVASASAPICDYADRLREAADLLQSQGANPYRVSAYRKAADSITGLDHAAIVDLVDREGIDGLDRLPHVGRGIATAHRGDGPHGALGPARTAARHRRSRATVHGGARPGPPSRRAHPRGTPRRHARGARTRGPRWTPGERARRRTATGGRHPREPAHDARAQSRLQCAGGRRGGPAARQ